MPYSNRNTTAICPYYLSDGAKSVTCEWLDDDAIQRQFRTPARCSKYMELLCCSTNWEKCPIAARMGRYYAAKGITAKRRPKRARKKVRPEGRKEITGQIRMEGT
jgi:hypothetical protein